MNSVKPAARAFALVPVLALMFAFSGVAHATPTTIYVGGNNASDATSDGTNPATPFATIQAAIDSATTTGDTIEVAAGTYAAFSVDGKSDLTITGAGAGSTIIAPSTLIDTKVGHKYTSDMQVSVFINNSTDITIEDMTVKDNGAAPGAGGPDALVFWNASTGSIADSAITGTYAINGDQTGQGIAVDAGSSQTTNLTVTDDTISGFQKNGIDAVDGNSVVGTNPGTITLTVTGGSITGAGSTNTIAQNGILVWNQGGGTVTGTVNGTTISDLVYSPATTPGDKAAGILTYGTATLPTVSNATFSNDDYYIENASTANTSIDATNTSIDATTGNTFGGVSPATATVTQLGAIEDKLYGAMEDATTQPLFILPNTFIATPGNLGIQVAVNLASDGDTVIVAPGTYNENVTINKSITLKGAQAGVSATSSRTHDSADESILPGNGTYEGIFTVTAPNVTIDGFDFGPSTDGSSVGPIGVDLGSSAGATVENSIFEHNQRGISLNGATDVTITNDLISDNNADSAAGANAGIWGNALNGITIENSELDGASNTAINFGPPAPTAFANDNITITNNVFKNDGNTAVIWQDENVTFSNNTGSNFDGSGLFISGSQNVSVTGNTLTSGATFNGISLSTASGSTSSEITITGNTINGFANGINVASGAMSDELTATGNDLSGNSTAGINAPTGASTLVSAEGNWWGDVSGPLDSISADGSTPDTNAGTGDSAIGAIDYSGWCTDASCTPDTSVPNVPTNLSAMFQYDSTTLGSGSYLSTTTEPGGNNLELTWDAPTATTTITGYHIIETYPDGTTGTGGGGPNTNAWLVDNGFGQHGDGAYTYQVEAVNANGDSAPSATFTLNYDATPPTVSVTPLATAGDLSGTVTFDITINDAFPATTTNSSIWVYLYDNAGTQKSKGAKVDLSSGTGTFTVDTTQLDDGAATLDVGRLEDAAGNFSGTGDNYFKNYTIDNSVTPPPSPSVTTDAAADVTSSDATLTGTNGPVDAQAESFWVSTSPTIATSSPNSIPSGVVSTPVLAAVSAGDQFTAPFSETTTAGIPSNFGPIKANTTYYYVAWVNVNGTWYAGNVESFTTSAAVKGSNSAEVHTRVQKDVTSSNATLEGKSGSDDATDHSFWVSRTLIDTSSPTIPVGVYSTPDLGAIASNTPFSIQLSSLETNAVVNGQVSGTMPTVTPDTTYYYVAWAMVNGTWYHGNVKSFTTSSVTPPPVVLTAPILVSPANDSTTTDPAFDNTWDPVTGAASYDYQTANTLNGDGTLGPVIYSDTSTSTNYTITPTLITRSNNAGTPPGDYYWEVAAVDAEGNVGPWSTINKVTYDPSYVAASTTPSVTAGPTTGQTDSDATLVGTNGPVAADASSFWVSLTPGIDTSDPNTLPSGVYGTPGLGAEAAGQSFNTTLSAMTADAGLPAVTAGTTYYYVAWVEVDGTWYPSAEQTAVTTAASSGPVANLQTLTSTDDAPVSITLGGNANAVSFATTSSPTNGTLSGTLPNLVYTPKADFNGTDSFSFVGIASDGTTESAPATITINVSAAAVAAPTANSEFLPVVENTATPITLSGSSPRSSATLSYTVMGSGPANGTLSGTAPDLTYTPTTGFTGTDTFTYIVNDGTANSSNATVTIHVISAHNQSVTVAENGSVGITLSTDGSDNSDALTYATTTSPTNGTLSGTFPDLTYTPNPGYSGSASFGFSVTDTTSGGTATSNGTVSITVTPTVSPSFVFGGGGGGGTSGTSGGNSPFHGNNNTGTPPSSTGGQVLGAAVYNFTKNFGIGTDDEDVTQLQLILIADGDLKIATPTGYFGALTKAAVEEYQAANDISPITGYVGPLTRAVLNVGTIPTSG